MPTFAYTARGRDGKIQKGVAEGQTKEIVLDTLMTKGLVVTSLEEVTGRIANVPAATRGASEQRRRLRSKITSQDMILFTRQLGTMLEAGVTLLRSLNILITQVESKSLLRILEQVKKEIEAGKTLRNAMEKHPKVFPNFWLNLVETGEASGHLARSLNQIAAFLESSSNVRQKVISAMMYPAILTLVSITAVIIFVTKIVPVFSGILQSFDIALPPLTKIVLSFSAIVTRYLFYVFGIGFIMGIVLFQLSKTPQGRLLLDRAVLRVPLFGNLVELVCCERFASSLGTLLESGVSILPALEIVGKTVDNHVYQLALDQVKEQVREGKSLAVPLERSGVFPQMLVQMVTVGEEVGELGKMLQRVSEFYKQKIDLMISRITSLVEPVILVVMGVVVAVLIMSMFLPIFKLSQVGGGV